MKNQIVLFVIGVLIGAVISTGAFYVYTTTINGNCSNNTTQMGGGGQPPEMPGNSNGQPPEMPGASNGNDTQQTNNTQENA